jgi:hypothetical protein
VLLVATATVPALVVDLLSTGWSVAGEPRSASSSRTTTPAAANEATVIRAGPGSNRRPGRAARGKPSASNAPASRSTCRLNSRASGAGSAHSCSVWFRSHTGRAASGAKPYCSAGRSARCLRSWQVSHEPMCRLTRLRVTAARRPSQSPRISLSSAQDRRPVRATSSTPSAASRWPRARDTIACAWLRDTPSTTASSVPPSSWRALRSMISRSARSRPSIAVLTSSRSSACCADSPGSGSAKFSA